MLTHKIQNTYGLCDPQKCNENPIWMFEKEYLKQNGVESLQSFKLCCFQSEWKDVQSNPELYINARAIFNQQLAQKN